MLFWPILGIFIIALGYVVRRNFDFPDNRNLDGAVNMTGWAPIALATATPINPIGPGPVITTDSPATNPPTTTSRSS